MAPPPQARLAAKGWSKSQQWLRSGPHPVAAHPVEKNKGHHSHENHRHLLRRIGLRFARAQDRGGGARTSRPAVLRLRPAPPQGARLRRRLCTTGIGVPHQIHRHSPAIGRHLTGSALTDDVDVPDGHYAEETMKATVVPNRNAIMLAIAFGLAAAQQGRRRRRRRPWRRPLHLSQTAGRAPSMPSRQCRIEALEGYADRSPSTRPMSTSRRPPSSRTAPSTARPSGEPWSCYKGGARHCGRCGTCVERREAFHLAGVEDPTEYADPDFWRAATSRFSAEEVR